MLTNFNMVNAFTGQSCPIVHLGDLAKIREKKKTCALRGFHCSNATKVCDTTTIDESEWEALLEGLCNPYKEGHARHFISLYR